MASHITDLEEILPGCDQPVVTFPFASASCSLPLPTRIAFVGNYLPRQCGIATFTTDLLSAVQTAYPNSQCLCVSVNDVEGGYDYPEVVRFEIEEQDLPSYLRAADFLNISDVDIVCLQHEFGIFGGPVGGRDGHRALRDQMQILRGFARHCANVCAKVCAIKKILIF